MLAKVVDEPDLIRDDRGVVHNSNVSAHRAYIAKRNAAIANEKRIEKLEIANLELSQKLDLILQLLKDKK